MTATRALTMVDGVQVVVPDTLDLITPYVLYEQQDWFEDELRFLRKLLRPGEQVIDIGANHGVYTLSMAKAVGPTGRVWAFEPASSTAQLLAAGIEANDFGHIVLDRRALSDHAGTAELSLDVHSELNALVNENTPQGARETVALTTLDDCIASHGWADIDLMKIDAEGEERRILDGGRRFFAEFSPLVEYEIKASDQVNLGLVEAFAERGYASYRLVPALDLLVPFDPAAPADGYLLNLFACKPDRAALLAERGHLVRSPSDPARIPMVDRADKHDWRQALRALPYAIGLWPTWEACVLEGHSVDILQALQLHALSHDPEQTAGARFHALEHSLALLHAVCQQGASFLRLASLARVAHEYGARSLAVATLDQLCSDIIQRRQLDPREPFLAPAERFDAVPVTGPIGNWVLAAALEQRERVGSFSSFYAGPDAVTRLENIAQLGYASDEMLRRRRLLRARFGPGAAAAPESG